MRARVAVEFQVEHRRQLGVGGERGAHVRGLQVRGRAEPE
jgi:hypothetical protein